MTADKRTGSPIKIVPVKLIVLFLLFSAGILVTMAVYHHSQRKRLITENQNDLAAISTLKTAQIKVWYNERIGDAFTIRSNEPLIYRFAQYIEHRDDQTMRRELLNWMNSLTDSYDYKNVLLADSSLNVVLSVLPDETSCGDMIMEDLAVLKKSRQVILTDIHRSEVVPYAHMDLLIPLISAGDENNLSGILILRIDPERILFPLIQSVPVPSESMETLIFKREGDSILYLNELRHQRNTTLKLKLPVTNQDLLAAKAVMGIEGVVEGVDYRNIPVIGYISKIPEMSWFMVAKVDKKEVETPLRRLFLQTIILTILLILVNASIFGIILWDLRLKTYKQELKNELEKKALESHFQYLIKYANDIITLIDKDFTIVEANDKALETYGYSRTEMIGLDANALKATSSPDPVPDRRKLLDETGSAFYETIHKRKDGTEFPVEISSRVIDIEGHRFYQAIARDITWRKRNERILQENEERLRRTLDNMLEGCQILGSDWRYLYINKMAEKHNRRPKEELLGKTNTEIWPGIEETELYGLLCKCMETRNPQFIENEFTFPDGVSNWFEISIQPVEEGILILSTDITERKKSEQHLILHNKIADVFLTVPDEEMFNDILKIILDELESPFGVFGYIGDEGALIVPTMTRQIWDKCEVPDKNIVFPRSTWGCSSWPEAIRQKRLVYSNTNSANIPEGHVSITRHISLPIIYQGEVIGLFQVANKKQDYTDSDIKLLENIAGLVAPILSERLKKKSAEEEIIKLNRELEERVIQRTRQLESVNKELEAFTYSVSHDLRAPLRTINSFTNILLEEFGAKLDDEGRRICGIISSGATSMGGLIDDLLDLSRIGRSSLHYTFLNMKEIVDSVIDEVAGENKRIKFKTENIPPVFGDINLIRQVWQNLISNAVKYSSKKEAPEIIIDSTQDTDYITYSISDNGAGFERQYLHKLFGVFQRLHSQDEFEGNGVGLAIVRRIIKMHNGKVWADGEVNRGAVFYFRLPINYQTIKPEE